jgi:NAD(P)-dependent dehydrogenase (short-subunit alcohol dehydrogenase family)
MRDIGPGTVAVVTGAGSGMGRAFATRFAAAGASVVLADVQQDALDETVAALASDGGDVLGVLTDVSQESAVQALASATLERFGAVHILMNNAGVEGFLDGPIWTATRKDWDWTLGVNLMGVVHGIRTFVPIMLEQNVPAHIVNTASMTSLVRVRNIYGVSKHAVLALTEMLAEQLHALSAPIGVSALVPGTIATNLFRGTRNRPAALLNESGPVMSEAGAQVRDTFHELLSKGMPPDEVAEMVFDAITTGTFYVLTDSDWDDRIRQRTDDILERRNPWAVAK